eukprot:CAMPEP_0168618020 /NCGR_PEP_ID=MMETSP0449_2-20121227/5850_1 /TAXON_ID=1082188 /ORGANISM="Strombidium rassoulzadegani, Strain ras09" /LENGTH=108 /DNA_ID=CAMNT_0008658869 /DNA_START=798 /DNA_END=1120 /DNA_ORIENTATION=+
MSKHCKHIWRNYIEPAGFKSLKVIAHSAGGFCLTGIQQTFQSTFYKTVSSIAITDSCVIEKSLLTPHQREFMAKRAVHYISSYEDLGIEERGRTRRGSAHMEVCPHVS